MSVQAVLAGNIESALTLRCQCVLHYLPFSLFFFVVVNNCCFDCLILMRACWLLFFGLSKISPLPGGRVFYSKSERGMQKFTASKNIAAGLQARIFESFVHMRYQTFRCSSPERPIAGFRVSNISAWLCSV